MIMPHGSVTRGDHTEASSVEQVPEADLRKTDPDTIHVLIVEDDQALARDLENALRSNGYVTELATSGNTADEMLRSRHYRIVILDLELPGMDGLEVLRRMRRRGITTPVLIVTA